jgi:site-specific recombinase XerD
MLKYYDSLLAEGLTIPRIAKCLRLAAKLDEVLKKDLKTINKEDVVHYLGFLEKTNYAQWTKSDFKIGMKKFIRWLNDGKEPEYFKLIKAGVRNQSKLLPQEVITETDAMKLISSASELRDKALISCLYESGCRIGEILTLKIKHVVCEE